MTEAKELREAIVLLREEMGAWGSADYRAAIRKVVDAAEAHLATLPREVTIERWVIVDRHGIVIDTGPESEAEAIGSCESYVDGCQVVRLTGTATLPGRK